MTVRPTTSPRSVFCVIDEEHRDLAAAEDAAAGRFSIQGTTLTLGVEPDWMGAALPADREWRLEWSKFYFGLDLAWAYWRTRDQRFVRAWEQLDRMKPGSDVGAWLWRLATNVVLNAMRSERRRVARVAPVAEPDLLERAQLGTPLPVRRLSLDAAIATLPERAREVFVLHDVEGFAGPEIAQMLGVAEGTVRAHLHRARSLMREALR